MFVKPMSQPLLYGSRQLQDHMHKTQGLKDCKMTSRIRNALRSSATKLVKRQRLTGRVGKTGPRLRVRKQLGETLAQDHGGTRKDHLTVARCTQLLELPPPTFHLCIIVLDLWTFLIMAYYPSAVETLIGGHEDHGIQGVLFPVPLAHPTGIEGHLTRLPQVLNPLDTGHVLLLS